VENSKAVKIAAMLCVVFVAAGCGTTKTLTVTNTVTKTVTTTAAVTAPCTGSDLSGSFDEQQGSAGAGQITYVLTLTNTSAAACSLPGFPQLQLLDASGNDLPTKTAAEPGTIAWAKVLPGHSVSIDARFSPDVPGTGDHTPGACQPVAATLGVTPPGGGTLDAPIKPPTSVCEQGSMMLRAG
jgi:hypothetical protein